MDRIAKPLTSCFCSGYELAMTLLQIKGRKHPTAAQEGASALRMLRTISLPAMHQAAEHIRDWLCRLAHVPLVAATSRANNNNTNSSTSNCAIMLGVGALAMGSNSIGLRLGLEKSRANILAAWKW
jgi:hypothetical protein